MRQLTLPFVKEEPSDVVLDPNVEKILVVWMAQMIVEVISQQQRRDDDCQTDQQ